MTVSRARYFSGQYLRTADFIDEQRHHLDMRRRHNIGHHSFGVIAGLDLIEEEGALILGSGMAVDGYGRELVVFQRMPVAIRRAIQERDATTLEVWLAYSRVLASDAPMGYASCVDAEAADREIEKPIVRFVVPDPDQTDRRCPKTVPPGDCPFGPDRTPPDDPIDDYPVFLGTITDGNDDDSLTYTIDIADRPWAGLVGEEIRAPSGRARVQIGAEDDADPYRFAVRVPGETPDEIPRLAVQAGGSVVAVGRTSFLGNVTVNGGLEIEAGPAVVQAQPWTLYRTPIDGGSELRLEMAHSDSEANAVSVGVWKVDPADDQERFVPCLTIDDECNVIVHGNLIVQGTITEGGERPTAQLSAEAVAFVNSAFLGGISGASALIEEFYRSPFDGAGDGVVPGSGGV